MQNEKGVWVRDIVTHASADSKGVSYTIRANAYWYWGGKKLPVTYKDFVYTLPERASHGTRARARRGPRPFTPITR